jgi:CRISPR type IV-associated DEAD/DEAH-box helicase Csf4
MIDEAHQFEQAVAAVNSDQVSLHTLRASLSRLQRSEQLGQGSIVSKARGDVLSLRKYLQNFNREADVGKFQCLTNADEATQQELSLKLLPLSEKLMSKSLNKLPDIERYRAALKAIRTSLESKSSSSFNRVDLGFSTDRRYPSLYCGPARVDTQLGHIWKTAKGGVVLASATLYIMDANGNNKCDYLRGLLAVPFARISTPAPITEKYLYSLPMLYIPGAQRRNNLVPPGGLTPNTDEQWHRALGTALAQVTTTARGGTLVLFTAYKDIQGVAAELATLDPTGNIQARIVAQQPNRRFSECERRFREIHACGERPILLALGTAWTGIDLKDRAASDQTDTLLTDLVIARLPLNLNRSNSMLRRIEQMHMHPLINECLLVFKQGLGRLIRRENVEHRRLWVFDARLFLEVKWPGMSTLLGSARRLLRQYQRSTEF